MAATKPKMVRMIKIPTTGVGSGGRSGMPSSSTECEVATGVTYAADDFVKSVDGPLLCECERTKPGNSRLGTTPTGENGAVVCDFGLRRVSRTREAGVGKRSWFSFFGGRLVVYSRASAEGVGPWWVVVRGVM